MDHSEWSIRWCHSDGSAARERAFSTERSRLSATETDAERSRVAAGKVAV